MLTPARGGLAALLLAGILAGRAAADVVDFTWSPAYPVMGEMVTYTATDNHSRPVTQWLWQYKFTSGSCTDDWHNGPLQGQPVVYFFENDPGIWLVRLTVTYGGPPYPPPPNTVITKSVIILPPTKVVPTDGWDTPAALGVPITVKFRIETSVRPCGIYLDAEAQELIVDRWLLSPPFSPEYPPDDTLWTPYPPPHPLFKIPHPGNQIEDVKDQTIPPGAWAQIPVGATYSRARQCMRLRYTDPCGDVQYIDLQSVNVNRIKVDANHWKVTAGP